MAAILLLDLHARADGFVANDAFATVHARLSGMGHSVETARLVASDLGSEGAFLEAITGRVRASGAEIVVLARAWDPSLADAARRGAPGAVVVRLTRGVRAAIDGAFDHVLDPEGLVALAGGDAAPRAAEFRRTTAAEMRRRLAVHGPDTAASAGPTGRPSISGPSSGCPFLLDARTSPAFAGAGLDPARTQTKGCSFCLDNSGAYVVPPEGEVVRAWLDGLRAVRAARPDAREVLLTDERPHPYLPAFFEALAAEPGLAPVELLWKSRADWLLEYSDNVERACAAAARSGSVLHLYLMGFESFDLSHLELFNKGHGPEVNEAAIAKMRDLQERFPASFEHRRYRSHGIVLFTPWTAPESLLENARWMRRLRFHELRSEAVKTRLRLYPRVPLHHLAERDGLLAESFDEGRGDRAAEQGYDASVPWRFRDARTEAIFQLANALHEVDRALLDADLLEIATRFVLRWPGIAHAPGLAHLPVRAAAEAWCAPLSFLCAALGTAAAGFDPEVEAIGKTGKRAALKEAVRGADAEDLARAYRAMGLAAEVVLRHTLDPATGAHGAGDDRAIVAVAQDEAALREVLAAQRALGAARGEQRRGDRAEQTRWVRALGALMGYPGCCVEAFAGLADRGDNLENERAPFLRRPAEALHPLLHRTGAVRWIAHHVCTPGCPASIERARKGLEVLGAIDEDAPARLLSALRTPSLFLDYDRFASLEGSWSGARFEVRGAVAAGRCRDLEVLLGKARSVRLAPDAVVVELDGGAARRLPATRPLLAEPGRALAEPALAALRAGGAHGTPRAPGAASASGPTGAPPLPAALRGDAPGTERGAGAAASTGPALPALPAALRAGVRAAAFVVTRVERGEHRHDVRLSRGAEHIDVRLRLHAEGAPYTLRKGRWAVEVDDPQALSEPARAAIGVLVRALPP